MGEFSYTQPDDLSGYGDYSAGYGQAEYPEPGMPAAPPGGGYGSDDFSAGYGSADPAFTTEYDYQPGGYQQELASLIPQDVPLLGAILIEQGVLTPEALQEAMAKQHETGSSLAQILLEAGWAAPDQLVQALQIRATYGAAA